MADLSIFIDESGADGLSSRYYLITLVLHDQSNTLSEGIGRYEAALANKGLPNIPFHASPLLNGHDAYAHLDVITRARLLSAFRVFFRHLPVRYTTLVFETALYKSPETLTNAMRRSLIETIYDNLEEMQSFQKVKIYYDGGQSTVTTALHKAIDYTLSRDAVIYKPSTYQDYRLSQAADYICTIELTELKYLSGTQTATDERFFGGHVKFKKGPLKEARAKRLGRS